MGSWSSWTLGADGLESRESMVPRESEEVQLQPTIPEVEISDKDSVEISPEGLEVEDLPEEWMHPATLEDLPGFGKKMKPQWQKINLDLVFSHFNVLKGTRTVEEEGLQNGAGHTGFMVDGLKHFRPGKSWFPFGDGQLGGAGAGFFRTRLIHNTEEQQHTGTFHFAFGQTGFWKYAGNDGKVILFGQLGIGRYRHQRDGTEPEDRHSDVALWTNISARYQHYVFYSGNLAFIGMLGGGVTKMFIRDFIYKGESFKSSDFKPHFYWSVGVGLRFFRNVF